MLFFFLWVNYRKKFVFRWQRIRAWHVSDRDIALNSFHVSKWQFISKIIAKTVLFRDSALFRDCAKTLLRSETVLSSETDQRLCFVRRLLIKRLFRASACYFQRLFRDSSMFSDPSETVRRLFRVFRDCNILKKLHNYCENVSFFIAQF